MSIEAAKAALESPEGRQRLHAFFAVECFNNCWEYIEKQNRTAEDTETMLALSFASFWHWTKRNDCQPKNMSIAYWQLARVHALAGRCEAANLYGHKSLEIALENQIPSFYIGYAYEALLRNSVESGNLAPQRELLSKAEEYLSLVDDEEDRKLLAADIAELKTKMDQAR